MLNVFPPFVQDVESESDEVPLERRRRPVNSPPVHPPPVVEATARPRPTAADRGNRPMVDPEATAESPIHPQDEDPPIPPQEVSSAFVSLAFSCVDFFLTYVFLKDY